jgi:hypothetical protein
MAIDPPLPCAGWGDQPEVCARLPFRQLRAIARAQLDPEDAL